MKLACRPVKKSLFHEASVVSRKLRSFLHWLFSCFPEASLVVASETSAKNVALLIIFSP